jgi:hypothetical protein
MILTRFPIVRFSDRDKGRWKDSQTDRHQQTEGHKQTELHRQTDTNRQTDRQKGYFNKFFAILRYSDTDKGRRKDGPKQTNRETDRETDTKIQTDTNTQTDRQKVIFTQFFYHKI